MRSLNSKVKQCLQLSDGDLTVWEEGFLENISDRTNSGQDCTRLSDAQIDKVEQIWAKHFGGDDAGR